MEPDLNLLPRPRELKLMPGSHRLTAPGLILLDTPEPQSLRTAASRATQAVHKLQLDWETVAFLPGGISPAVTLRVGPVVMTRDQGYRLVISAEGILIEASTHAGAFYGACTLAQIIDQCRLTLPCLEVEDDPDFPARGVMLDVSRDKVPSMETLFKLIDRLASWKVNQLQLYTEHTFAYRAHPEIWANASPLTGEEILALDAYCRERFVELVPNQNSFGHMHRWLEHPRYAPLGEMDREWTTPWGTLEKPFSLNPLDPGSLELVRSLYDELLPHFTSRLVNVGCDETFDLGMGQSKAEVERRGAGPVYLDFLLQIHAEITRRGRTMMYWSDIVFQHPELIPKLPKDAVALEWGYEANHPFEERAALLEANGLPFYLCPGTSSWNSIAGRSDNALSNLLSAAESGLKHGAVGYLNTDWGDSGHWQPLPVSYLGFAAGAAYSWALEANRSLDVPRALSWHAFGDPSCFAGRGAYELGNVYRAAGFEPENNSALFLALHWTLEQLRKHPRTFSVRFDRMLEAVELAEATWKQADIRTEDAYTIRREYDLVIRMLKHACRRGMLASEQDELDAAAQKKILQTDLETILCDYEDIWLERNRSGGLVDSLGRLEKARQDYLL